MFQNIPKVHGLNRNDSAPLYLQLMEILKEQIDAEIWPSGAMLPSEADLCRQYDVSQNVVRRALGELERAGVLYRVKGKGSFVSERKMMAYLLQTPIGFFANMEAQGLSVRTHILKQDVIPAPIPVAKALDVREGTEVLRLERLRWVRDVPVFLGVSYVILKANSKLAEEEFTNQSLNDVLTRRYGLVPTTGTRTIEATVAGIREAELLQLPIGSPLFLLYAVTCDQSGEPMEYTQVWLRGDRIAFQVDLGSSHSIKAPKGT